MKDLALGVLELHVVGTGSALKAVKVPLDGLSPSAVSTAQHRSKTNFSVTSHHNIEQPELFQQHCAYRVRLNAELGDRAHPPRFNPNSHPPQRSDRQRHGSGHAPVAGAPPPTPRALPSPCARRGERVVFPPRRPRCPWSWLTACDGVPPLPRAQWFGPLEAGWERQGLLFLSPERAEAGGSCREPPRGRDGCGGDEAGSPALLLPGRTQVPGYPGSTEPHRSPDGGRTGQDGSSGSLLMSVSKNQHDHKISQQCVF
ncbi:uncharacterized protein LOC115599907 [Calypte anna]|uniref:uncharacterized protein LOC115599907 n=1 Tax=Calypte anna TaxID=9244 RepID=UPI0011C466DC|nr:uncharacterized protein LOC115599907 [Calypte anna]